MKVLIFGSIQGPPGIHGVLAMLTIVSFNPAPVSSDAMDFLARLRRADFYVVR